MKKIVSCFLFLAVIIPSVFTQIPQTMNYQMVARGADGTPLSNQNLSVKLSLRTGNVSGEIIYCEIHHATSNQLGLVTLTIGIGTAVTGDFESIDWSTGIFYLQTEMDPNGGSIFQMLGITQLLSVPYSNYSKQTSGIRVLSQTERDAILSPDEGSMIFNSTFNDLELFKDGRWICMSEVSTAEAGSDQYLEAGQYFVTLSANTPIVGMGTWIQWDGPPTSLSDIHDPHASFTGQPNTYYRFKWIVSNNCSETFDFVSITLGFVCGQSTITFIYNGQEMTYGTIKSGFLCWIDRNLGATQVATSSNDPQAFGDYFQWGRLADGHQYIYSPITYDLSTTDVPGHSNFIYPSYSPYDWRTPSNSNLWQGAFGINNPCPSGWRVATSGDFYSVLFNTGSNQTLFESVLKLPAAGYKNNGGQLMSQGIEAWYWTSSGWESWSSCIHTSAVFDYIENTCVRSLAMPIRCVKD